MSSRLDKWKKRTRVILLSSGYEVEVKEMDVLERLTIGENGMPNPLLKYAQEGKAVDESLTKDPEALQAVAKMLRSVCQSAIIDPPLKENGSAEGISLDDITFAEKMEIFQELLGGGQMSKAAQFLREQNADMAAT